MSGFVQPQWSGFAMPGSCASGEAHQARHTPGHELDRIAYGQIAAIASQATPLRELSAHLISKPIPVTSASPRPDKALTP